MGGVLRCNAFAARGGIRRGLVHGFKLHRSSGDNALQGGTAEYRRRNQLGQGAGYSRHRFVLDEGSRRVQCGPHLSRPPRRRSAAPLAAAPGDRSQQGRQRRDRLPDAGALRGRRAALPSAARHLADRYQPGVEERGHRGICRHDTGGHQPSQGDKGGRRIDGSAVCPACNRAAHTPVHRGLHQCSSPRHERGRVSTVRGDAILDIERPIQNGGHYLERRLTHERREL
jgi:hypothetical protein